MIGQRTIGLVLVLGLVMLMGSSGVTAQERRADGETLGKVRFPVSCSAAAQPQFERAVALLHSFWYEEAVKAFTSVTTTDPACAMGYWGIAMSVYYPLWQSPSPAALQQGWAAVQKASAAGAKTQRERDYIAAIESFYRDSDKVDHRSRTLAYEKAMEQVSQRNPTDNEAALFYALALNATAAPTDKTYANQLKAAALLDKVYREEPNHPGVAHYLIHSYDYPPLATRALPAARGYAKIAPSVPHALHMPSHIFTRLGLWPESIQSNGASAAAGRDYSRKKGSEAAWDQTLHAMDYLVYAYLQGAQDGEAKRVVDELRAYRKSDPESLAAAYAFAAIPARWVLERQRWSEAATLTSMPADFPWARYPWGEAITSFARALGAARSGDTAGAQREVVKLQSLREALLNAKQGYWADQVEIQRRAAAAWTARAEGKNDDALALMRTAVELESSTEKHPVTPGALVPAREMLGEMLLELNQPTAARDEFEASLRAEPNRLRGVYGAARAAELAGDLGKAKLLYGRFVALTMQADTERPEIQKAKAFMAKP